MRNTLILIGQIHHNQQAGLDPFHAVVEATVSARPPGSADRAGGDPGVHSAHSFGLLGNARLYARLAGRWGTITTLIFLPAMYAIWFRIRPENTGTTETELHLQR
ncbi:hypothetical protein LNP05_19925 [Klebsiella pneumoniae subsp. pneumoniae]|nr:hypothetical protein [Klebsiella pneumoniae subsp. pneumoniae]